MYLDRNASKKMARSIKDKLYEEFYNYTPITFDVAMQVVGGSFYGEYIKNPQSFKDLAEKISTKYFEFIEKRPNSNVKEFIDEKTLKNLIEETVMYNV